MKNTIVIICGIVIIAVTAFFAYIIQQASQRQKELDKKQSDNLQQQKEINEIIKQKLESNEMNVVIKTLKENLPSANGKSKSKKVNVAKHTKN